jgi:hypothetical protein
MRTFRQLRRGNCGYGIEQITSAVARMEGRHGTIGEEGKTLPNMLAADCRHIVT